MHYNRSRLNALLLVMQYLLKFQPPGSGKLHYRAMFAFYLITACMIQAFILDLYFFLLSQILHDVFQV